VRGGARDARQEAEKPRFPAPQQWRYGVSDVLPAIRGIEGYEFHHIIRRPAALPMRTIGASQRPTLTLSTTLGAIGGAPLDLAHAWHKRPTPVHPTTPPSP